MALSANPKTAAEWTARLRGSDDPQEYAAYERWLEADPKNRDSAAVIDQIWQSVGALEDDPLVQEILAEPPRESRGWQRFWTPRLATAGALLSLLLAATVWFFWLGASDRYETLSGEQRIVELADGSRLHLNVKTRLEVALKNDVRDVRLVHGQAFFEVSPDPARPFVVTAGDKEITVLGTKFDVLLERGDTRVTVIEGRVAVTSLAADERPISDPSSTEANTPEVAEKAEPPSEAAPRLELATRDAVSWPQSALPSPLVPSEAIAAVEAWRSGRVIFDNTPLRQAVDELDRYTPMRVRLATADLGSMNVSGVFYVERLAEVDSLVFALENSLPIDVEQRGDELLLFASE